MMPCDHLLDADYPLSLDLLMDQHLGFTDALTRCRVCGQPYLLEMLDWRDGLRLFRMSMPSATHCRQLLRDVERGSCDLDRTRAEVQHLQTGNPFIDHLLLLDPAIPRILAVIPLEGQHLPGSSWRSLPCDGAWFDQLRLYAVIEKG